MTGVFPRANNPGTLAVFLQANTAIAWNLLIRRKATPIFSLHTGPARAWIRPVANTTSTGSNQMKRHASNLPQHLRSRSENTDADRRNAAPRSITANIGLSAEDGYDWLRQLKPA